MILMSETIQSAKRVVCAGAFLTLVALMFAAPALCAEAPGHLSAPSIETDAAELEMAVKHLTAEELKSEADRWLTLLQDNIYRLNQAKITLKRENDRIAAAKEAADEQASTKPGDTLADQAERETARKESTLEVVAELREQRIKIIDRMNIVVDELSAKIGRKSKEEEHEVVVTYRLYIDSVEGLQINVSDAQSTRSTIVTWVRSEEGGKRLLDHFLKFLGIVAGFWVLGNVLSRLVNRLMDVAGSTSQIMRKFMVDLTRRGLFAVGLLLGLSALGLNITPLIAVIGAAGFVIAFALQDTLSNFASGLMIMLYRPFDIEDFIETSGVMGTVKSMTLMTTNILTPDNKLMIVPNNSLWGQVITNVTGSHTRRVDLVFGIGYSDDIAKAEQVLSDILGSHPLVLEDPAPVIRVSELGDSSVNLICRPWVNTPDYWAVYWDVTRQVKERFDAAGISIPFPQRDVHVHHIEHQS